MKKCSDGDLNPGWNPNLNRSCRPQDRPRPMNKESESRRLYALKRPCAYSYLCFQWIYRLSVLLYTLGYHLNIVCFPAETGKLRKKMNKMSENKPDSGATAPEEPKIPKIQDKRPNYHIRNPGIWRAKRGKTPRRAL